MKTLTKIEAGEGSLPSVTTFSKLDRALEWVNGSAARVLHGGDPATKEASTGAEEAGDDAISRHIALGQAFARKGVTSIAQRGAAKGAGGGLTLSAEVIDELIEKMNSLPDKPIDNP